MDSAFVLPHPASMGASCILGLLLLTILRALLIPKKALPLAINHHRWDIFNRRAIQDFTANPQDLIKAGLKKVIDPKIAPRFAKGTFLVLPERYSEEVKNDERFSAYEALSRSSPQIILLELPGFESVFEGLMHNDVVLPGVAAMNRQLASLTSPMSEEVSHYLQTNWTDDPDWHTQSVSASMSGLIGQAAARIIVGPELCRNKEYHAITLSYTMSRGRALAAIHAWPRALHPLIHWFLPSCRNVRTQIRRAEKLITPILERTRRARARGDPPQAFSTLAWSDEYARAQGRSYNATLAQMRFTSSSIHNTSDLLGKVMLRICQRPDLIEPLRREIVAAFDGGSGAQHHSLGKLKLMESVMKETQRLEPAAERVSYPPPLTPERLTGYSIVNMFRVAKETVTLSDGTTIPKGTIFGFSYQNRFDPSMYPDPETFDPYRFMRMRQDPVQASLASFTKARSTHLSFGLGRHACPGRFMANDMIKLALSHILLKYDFKLVGEELPKLEMHGFVYAREPTAQILVRRRQEEVVL
ncbi:fumitremorgin C monooxygenase [Aspergillus lentulus]|uniref:cytochrome P450 n=1 Tax=Aspergillus lentulus TaxID=293939 RepID=UPI0013935BEB|nr:fumitremorgin C monooxygenase [Aspergillus lentulus]GFF43988.1 fumitremorgin C monooxygenase [Aspergillus lentulus]